MHAAPTDLGEHSYFSVLLKEKDQLSYVEQGTYFESELRVASG